MSEDGNVLTDTWKKFRRGLKSRLSFLRRRWATPALPRNADGKVLLHVGCGPVNSPEFINVDALPYAHVHIVTDDISRLSELADGTVDLVYMCHVLEHIRTPQVKRVLGEMRRILRPGGILRLSVPDFDRLLDVYRAAGGNLEVIRKQLMGGQDCDYNIHYGVFNRSTLAALLQEAGFRRIRSWEPQNCEHHDFRDKACKVMKVGAQAFEISLNIEAVK